MRKQYEALVAEISARTTWAVEYQTEHTDAGDNYSHLLLEGGWAYNNCDEKVNDRLFELGIELTPEQLESVTQHICDFGLWEMEPDNMYSTCGRSAGLVLDSYPLQEIEEQIEVESLEVESSFLVPLLRKAAGDRRLCIRYTPGRDCFESYEATDSCWTAVISDESLRMAVEESCPELFEETAETEVAA